MQQTVAQNLLRLYVPKLAKKDILMLLNDVFWYSLTYLMNYRILCILTEAAYREGGKGRRPPPYKTGGISPLGKIKSTERETMHVLALKFWF